MNIPQAMINSIGVGVVLLLLGLIVTWFWRSRDDVRRKAEVLATANEKLTTRIIELEHQMGVMARDVQPLSVAMSALLVRELTHLHTPELDGLMTRLGPPSTLSEAEEARFTELLLKRAHDVDDQIGPLERNAAVMLPLVLERVRLEMACRDETAMQLTVVAMPLDGATADAVAEKQLDEAG